MGFSFRIGLAIFMLVVVLPVLAQTEPHGPPTFIANFDRMMDVFNISTGENRALAAEKLEATLREASAAERAMPEWGRRADLFWALMNDMDVGIARLAMNATLGAAGTSAVRAKLLVGLARQTANPRRLDAMLALKEEVTHWTGTLSNGDAVELRAGLHALASDVDPKMRDLASEPWAAQFAATRQSDASFILKFDLHMINFKGTAPKNRIIAAQLLKEDLATADEGERTTAEWAERADQFWALMDDPDQEVSALAMSSTLGTMGTSAARARLLINKALKPDDPKRMNAVFDLSEEVRHWNGKLRAADVPEFEAGLRTLAFDGDPAMRDAAGNLWAYQFPGSGYPQLPVTSHYALLAIAPGVFMLLNVGMMLRGILRRRGLELEYASPGPAVEQAATMSKGVGYLLAILALGAILLDVWVIRRRTVGMSAGDLIQIASLGNVAAAALMMIAWSGNLVSGQRSVMRGMIRCCLFNAIIAAGMAAWMVMGFNDMKYLGGHPGPEIIMAAGGSGILAGAALLLAALVAVASRTIMEAKRA